MTSKLLIPGLWNSGPAHWQSHWERLPGFQRVNQRDWDTPRREEWVAELDRAVNAANCDVILVAHSLGCATVAYWSQKYPRHAGRIPGALLVAPADVEAAGFPAVTSGFSPMPLERRLPFPSIVIYSTNDVWVSPERAALFARSWGSDVVVMKDAGHINGESNLAMWPEGMQFLHKLERDAGAGLATEKDPGRG